MKMNSPAQCECGGPLVNLSSLFKKVCADCLQEYPWGLKENQQPLVKHQR